MFALIDEEPETDDGYVTLVNAEIAPDGTVTESDRRTGHWAWKHPHGDGTLTYTELRGDVRLTDVDFAYTEGKDVLHDVSVYAEPGQKVAFVGATGAGKTTITNLINRFYDIADGKIRYDGININKIKKADLRRSLGHCFAGDEPLHRHGDGEHPLRPSGRDGRGVPRGGKARRRGRLHHAPAAGLQHAADQQRREPLAGPAPAASPLPARRSPTRR